LTRSISSGDKLWEEQNHLGTRMNFSHNLGNVVRSEDYAAHSEWFPVEGGKRFKPSGSSLNWQPDLGSEAVSERAAEIAAQALRSHGGARCARSGGEAALTSCARLSGAGGTSVAAKPPQSDGAGKASSVATGRRLGGGEAAFALGINDTTFYGESPEAMKWVTPLTYFRGRPNYSNLVFSFMNRVAERVERSLDAHGGAQSAHCAGEASSVATVAAERHGSREAASVTSFARLSGAGGTSVAAKPPQSDGAGKASSVAAKPPLWPRSGLSGAHSAPWYLGCLAYYWCEQVPDFPIHPRIMPYLCADRSQGYDPAFWKEEMELQERWGRCAHSGGFAASVATDVASVGQSDGGREAASVASDARLGGALGAHSGGSAASVASDARLGIYDYLYGYGFLIPRVHTRLLAQHLKHARESGFTDYFAEASPNWGLDGPQMWMVAQLLAHPELDAQALMDEYYARYFIEAAAPMRRFYERCEELWMAQPPPAKWLKYYRNESQARLFPSAECRKLWAMLEEAKAAARQEKVRRRVDLVSDAFGVTERFVDYEEAKRALSAHSGGSAASVATQSPRWPHCGLGGDLVASVATDAASVASDARLGGALRAHCGREAASVAATPPRSDSASTWTAVRRCVAARVELERYVADIKIRQPLAMHNGELKDFVWLEPVYDAVLRALQSDGAGEASAVASDARLSGALGAHSDGEAASVASDARLGGALGAHSGGSAASVASDARLSGALGAHSGGSAASVASDARLGGALGAHSSAAAAALARVNSQRVEDCALQAASFEGAVIAGRRVGGLQYGADLPQGWVSKLEPKEGMVAAAIPEAVRTGKAGLRLANQEYASVYQWMPVDSKAQGYEVEAWFRGELSDSARVSLFLAWANEKGQLMEELNYGVRFEGGARCAHGAGEASSVASGARLGGAPSAHCGGEAAPGGWTRLRTGTLVPPRAKWVGVVILVNFMLPGDWADVDDVKLRSY
jgi:hypothetical protein